MKSQRPGPPHRNRVSPDVIVASIRQRIIDARLRPGEQLPTYDELQRRFRTTRMTVRRACERLVQHGFVQSRSKVGTYVSEFPPHLYRYGFVFPSHNADGSFTWSRYYDALKLAAGQIIGKKGPREVALYEDVEGHDDNEDYQLLVRDLAAQRLAGAVFPLITPGLQTSPIFHDRSTPLVRAGSMDALVRYHVQLDRDSFYRRALELFAHHGRRRVALLTIFVQKPDLLCCPAFGLERRGLTTRPYWTLGIEPRSAQWVPHVINALLRAHEPDRPDALIVDDDHLVGPVAAALREMGVRVPQDLMVVGHWNFPLPTAGTEGLSLIGFDAREIVARSIEIIDNVRRGRLDTPTLLDVPARSAQEAESFIHSEV